MSRGIESPYLVLPPAEIGSAQQEIPVTKQAIVVQCIEDHPGNPGWWRYSRPVLRHVTEVPNSSTIRWWYVQRPHLECRQAQQEWDLKYS